MRKVELIGDAQGNEIGVKISWLERVVRDIAQASGENDTAEISQNFAISGSYTTTRTLNVAAPTAANIAAVLATLIDDLKKGGANRTL
jgi:hypothetical protein